LKSIARTGVGFDSIDIQAAADNKVVVTTTPGANRHAVADHAIVFMLMLTRLIPANQKMVADGKWTRVVGWDAYGKTLGIIGVGAIGKETARRSSGFDMPLLGYDIAPDYAFAEKHNLRYVALDELLAKSDFVSLHVPYYHATHHMIGERELNLMKPTAYLINTARGGIIDEDALYNALVEKRIRGAALDVCENEPNFASPLLRLDNVIWTPHVAGITLESRLACLAGACKNSWAVLSGNGDYHQIKPGTLY
jgi:D-3-phosphoglycerate dehydrogenase